MLPYRPLLRLFSAPRSAVQRPRLIVVDHAKRWVAAVALTAIVLIGVGAFGDRLLATTQSLSCEAPPTVLPAG